MQNQMYAPAKINLTLEVQGKRSDGYHNLNSLMQSVSLYDKIKISMTKSKKIQVQCSDTLIPSDDKNICYIAAEKFFENTKIQNPGIIIHIEKNIPSQAGLGGGSADAAATLKLLNEMFNANISQAQLRAIAAKIGADVPFCIINGTCQAKGIGEILKPIESNLRYSVVVVKPEINISTKEAYAKVDEKFNCFSNYTENAVKALEHGSLDSLIKNIYNSFESALNLNEVAHIKNIMLNYNAQVASMSGSGSAVFGIFKDDVHAKVCEKEMKKLYKDVFVCEPI